MPVYEYVCTACGHAIEVIHGINVPGPTLCDECGGALRKLLSPPAIVFKGSGWAKKDARSSGSGASHAGGSSKRGATHETPAPTGAGTGTAAKSTSTATAGTTGAGGGDGA